MSNQGEPVSDLGEMLRDARERQRVTLRDAAVATRIKESYLEALEEGNYALLPGPAYVTGFLRNYASFLGLHPDDAIQEYYAMRPAVAPMVKPATKVLASGHERENRSRVLGVLGGIVLLLGGGFAIKQYNDASAHSMQPPLNLTPNNVGAPTAVPANGAPDLQVRLQAVKPVWVRVTADGQRVFQGRLVPGVAPHWQAHHTLYVMAMNGKRVMVSVNGQAAVRMQRLPGPAVAEATAAGWRVVS